MRIPRLSQCTWWAWLAGFVLAATPVVAQNRPAANTGLGILVVSVDPAPSEDADSVVASFLEELRRTAPAAGLRVLSWLDVVRGFPHLPRPGTLSSSDLIEAGKTFGAVIVGLNVQARADGALDVRPTLMLWQPTQAIMPRAGVVAATAQEAGQRLARQVLSDSLVQRLRLAALACPTTALFEFQVDVQARLIADSVTVRSRHHPGGDGDMLLQFVVDTLGRPERATFKVLKASDTTFARAIQDTVRHWRFEPARRGTCRVRQLMHIFIN